MDSSTAAHSVDRTVRRSGESRAGWTVESKASSTADPMAGLRAVDLVEPRADASVLSWAGSSAASTDDSKVVSKVVCWAGSSVARMVGSTVLRTEDHSVARTALSLAAHWAASRGACSADSSVS